MGIKVGETGLEYEPMSVQSLFGANQYYLVPRYQRGYSWGREEILELLLDIDEAKDSFSDEAYLLGQIIACPSAQPNHELKKEVFQWDLIDGQQRCTTLYVMLLVAEKMLSTTEAPEGYVVDEYKVASRQMMRKIPNSSQTDYFPRIRSASNGETVLKGYLNSANLNDPDGPTQKNLNLAIELITKHFESKSYSQLEEFVDFFLKNVWLVRLQLPSSAHAIRVFQKVNNRGLELDDADLIKNFLFQRATESEYPLLSTQWESATNLLDKARLKRVKSMEFLMKLMIGIETGNSVPRGKLYVEWEKRLDTSEKVQILAQRLPERANQLVRISKSQLPQSGTQTDISLGTHISAWIQQYEVLLAGSHLEPKPYEKLLRMVEDRAMLSYWANEPNNDFERIIHPWAYEIGKLDANPSNQEFVRASEKARENFAALSESAFIGIQKLNYDVQSHRDRLRYILARVNSRVQGMLHISPTPLEKLMVTSKDEVQGFDIDHIFPKDDALKFKWEQSAEKDKKFGNASRAKLSIGSIGNLILLHEADNRSQGNALPNDEEKIKNLSSSELYLNRVLVDRSKWEMMQGKKGEQLDQLHSQLGVSVARWNEDSVDKLAAFYWSILLEDLKANLLIEG
jgi:hypothetical protein